MAFVGVTELRAGLFGFLLSLAPALPALAASFDCAKATTVSERLICADPLLSSEDESLAAAYAKALATTPLPVDLRADEMDWILNTRDREREFNGLHKAMLDRIARLIDWNKADIESARARPLTLIDETCAGSTAALSTCFVKRSGRLGTTLAWQITGYRGNGREAGEGQTIFRIEGNDARPILWREFGRITFADPELIQTPDGTLLDLPGDWPGSANFSQNALFGLDGAAWRQIDISGLPADLRRLTPPEFQILRGFHPNWRATRLQVPLWRETDLNCCPTGPLAEARLMRVGWRITVERVIIHDETGR